MNTKVKICGITRLEDAKMAIDLGADLIGLNFFEKSKRYIKPSKAKAIVDYCKSRDVDTVGVVVDLDHSSIEKIIKIIGVDYIQLHGSETADFCRGLSKSAIKAIHLYDESDLDRIRAFASCATVLIDYPDFSEFGGTGKQVDSELAKKAAEIAPVILAGGIKQENVVALVNKIKPAMIDLCSSVETSPGIKSGQKLKAFFNRLSEAESMKHNQYYGQFGGAFVPETLIAPLKEIELAYQSISKNRAFQEELSVLLKDFVGRPTPLTYAGNLSRAVGGAQIYLKREDLTHTGAHKINNALGQGLLAKRMGKTRIVAETGAGQHGVATAAIAALLGLSCVIYMGSNDIKRQAPNVFRIGLLGATVIPVDTGSKTLKDAVSAALKDWVDNLSTTYYLIGSALGPHPYPKMVRNFQVIIGKETKRQIVEHCNRMPDEIVACIGGGSNAIGIFYPFINETGVALTGVETGGIGISSGEHAARFQSGAIGVFQGTKTYLLQNEAGQTMETHSISAGLNYPAVGPEHAYLREINRAQYTSVTDAEALDALKLLAKTEGIIPALESAHALSYAIKRAPQLSEDKIIVVNLSGRGDKDIDIISNKI